MRSKREGDRGSEVKALASWSWDAGLAGAGQGRARDRKRLDCRQQPAVHGGGREARGCRAESEEPVKGEEEEWRGRPSSTPTTPNFQVDRGPLTDPA